MGLVVQVSDEFLVFGEKRANGKHLLRATSVVHTLGRCFLRPASATVHKHT